MGSLNMNMNMNMNMGAAGTSVGGATTRVRFNTQDYRKYVSLDVNGNVNEAVIPANTGVMRFPAYWDADLRAYEYLNEFLAVRYPDWRTRLANFVAGVGAPFDLTPPHLLGQAALTNEVLQMLDRAPDREDRFLEIIDQHDAEGSISYFLGMLMIDPFRMPALNLLIRVARRIGEHIVMCLKGEFRCPRPSQLCAAIVPMIDPPATPAFPSGHSLQARLIALSLRVAQPPMRPVHLLDDLGERIGENRIIAGLHFPKDHLVGKGVADWCQSALLDPLLQLDAQGQPVAGPSKYKALVDAARIELANQWAVAPPGTPA
jgi:acid phosphatase (class A)